MGGTRKWTAEIGGHGLVIELLTRVLTWSQTKSGLRTWIWSVKIHISIQELFLDFGHEHEQTPNFRHGVGHACPQIPSGQFWSVILFDPELKHAEMKLTLDVWSYSMDLPRTTRPAREFLPSNLVVHEFLYNLFCGQSETFRLKVY